MEYKSVNRAARRGHFNMSLWVENPKRPFNNRSRTKVTKHSVNGNRVGSRQPELDKEFIYGQIHGRL